jgi:hypothetical protein
MDGIAPKRKKIVSHADSLRRQFEQLCNQAMYQTLMWCAGFSMAGSVAQSGQSCQLLAAQTPHLITQLSSCYLSCYRHRYLVNAEEDIRHHIPGQLALESPLDGIRIGRERLIRHCKNCFFSPIGFRPRSLDWPLPIWDKDSETELVLIRKGYSIYYRPTESRIPMRQMMLDHAQRNPLAADLDLEILPADVLKRPVAMVEGKISGSIKPLPLAFGTRLLRSPRGIAHEAHSSLMRILQIALCESRAFNGEFSDHANPHESIGVMLVDEPARTVLWHTDAAHFVLGVNLGRYAEDTGPLG